MDKLFEVDKTSKSGLPEITLTDDQQNALKVFSKFMVTDNEKYMIIDGAAGCGKSTLIRHLFLSLEQKRKMLKTLFRSDEHDDKFIAIPTATTNKAVAVLAELSGMATQTIHSFLNLKVTKQFNTGREVLTRGRGYGPICNKLIIVDEASMMSDELFAYLHETCENCKIVLIGDQFQLAPVKQKESIITKLACPKATLHKVVRHTGDILKTSTQFREAVISGVFPTIQPSPEILHVDGTEFQKLIDQAYTDPDYTPNSVKILAWTNKQIIKYNTYIRALNNLPAQFQVGEKVITTKPIMSSSYCRRTDEIVTITNIFEERQDPVTEVMGRYFELEGSYVAFLPTNPLHEKQVLNYLAKNKDWTQYWNIKEHWLDLRPIFASTVHKAQGSTYDQVFIDLSDIGKCTINSDIARLLYVATSRARKRVIYRGNLPARLFKKAA